LTLKYENSIDTKNSDIDITNNSYKDNKFNNSNSFVKLAKLEIKRIDCFADFIIVIYRDKLFFDIFKKSGMLIERKYICNAPNVRLDILKLDKVILPRLEWSDRYVDII